MNAIEGLRRVGKFIAYGWAGISALIVFFTWREAMTDWNRATLRSERDWSNLGSALLNAFQAAGVCLIVYAVFWLIGIGLGWILRVFLTPRSPV